MDCVTTPSVVGGGDVDGDGLGDVLAAYVANNGAEADVIPGGSSGEVEVDQLDARVAMESGAPSRGAELALGDLNDDGLADLVARVYEGGLGRHGDTYVVFGPGTGVADLGAANVILRGDPDGEIGTLSAATGDADGDGAADLLLGAGGGGTAAWAYLGPLAPGTTSLDEADVGVTADADTLSDLATVALTDFDGDGLGDLLLGACRAPEGGADGGVVYAPAWEE